MSRQIIWNSERLRLLYSLQSAALLPDHHDWERFPEKLLVQNLPLLSNPAAATGAGQVGRGFAACTQWLTDGCGWWLA